MEINAKRYYHIFPFGKVTGGSEIIIWGAGEVGREYIQQLERTEYCQIKYIVDSNWENITGNEKAVFSPEKIAKETEPIIVIAIANIKAVLDIKERIKRICSNAKVVHDDQLCDIPEIENSYLINLLKTINREVISIESNLKYINHPEDNKGKWEEYCLEVRKLLHIYGVDKYQLVRVGGKHDGGYVMLDDFEKVQLAYSFGIGNDISWDKSIADKGIHVFMYDHTIADLPVNNEKFHFFKKGIAEADTLDRQLFSLKTLISENGHEKEEKIILKIDVEGAEWDILEKIEPDILKIFSQIVIEFHGMTTMDYSLKIKKALGKLNKTHAVIHVHGNNYGAALSYGQGIMPDSLEVTYVNRGIYCIKEIGDIRLPITIDERCYCERDEFKLGKWNSV